MRKLNYEKLMAQKPTLYDKLTNHLGQEVFCYEHPHHGDEYPVIVVIENIAVNSEFYDTSDFYIGSDYMPCLVNGEIDCAFNFN